MKTINDNIELIDIIVIGAGAAGMTAALYSLRAGKTVTVFENESIGGQIASSPRVENFPSIKEIAGADFADNLFNQITDLGANLELEKIEKIEKVKYLEKEIFEVTSEYNTYYAKAVIIATGAKHRHIGVSGEEDLIGKGVSYCAVCDGAFYKNQDVCLIGDANTALQYAVLLSNYCNKVYLNTLFDKFFGEKYLVDIIKQKENIIIEHNLNLKEFLVENGNFKGLKFQKTDTLEYKEFEVASCFIAIGQIPENDAFKNIVELEKGYIKTNEDMETSTKGLFAVGDCRLKKIRQLTTAVNDGTIASVNACNYIDKTF